MKAKLKQILPKGIKIKKNALKNILFTFIKLDPAHNSFSLFLVWYVHT